MAETITQTNVLVRTNDGQEMQTAVENYNAQEVADTINNQSLNTIAIGDVIVHRSYVTGVRPVESTGGKGRKVVVRTNDGQEVETTVENYKPMEIVTLINNQSLNVIAIGDLVVHRAHITGVKPVAV